MTPLNLVEMTRKKEKKPLWEQIAQITTKSGPVARKGIGKGDAA